MLFWRSKKKDEQTTAAPPKCLGVARGQWGENVAADYLTGQGWRILERNARPCRRDQRCELDIVAFIPSSSQVVFVEVKTDRKSVV